MYFNSNVTQTKKQLHRRITGRGLAVKEKLSHMHCSKNSIDALVGGIENETPVDSIRAVPSEIDLRSGKDKSTS